MIRIAGVDLNQTKKIQYALTKIYGIGLKSAQLILVKACINKNLKTKELTNTDIIRLRKSLETSYIVESSLKRKITSNITRLSEINSTRGRKHRNHLPVRGQRTRTNARTKRGPKKTIAGKKK